MNDSKVAPVEAQAVPDQPVAMVEKGCLAWSHIPFDYSGPLFTRPTLAAADLHQQQETDFDDPRVQTVYKLLCADEAPPKDSNEHWEGWLARRIVDAVAASPAAAADERTLHAVTQPHPENTAFWDGVRWAQDGAAAEAEAGVPTGWKLRITADADEWSASHEGLGTSTYCGIRDESGTVVALAVAQAPGYDDLPDCRAIAERIVQCVHAASSPVAPVGAPTRLQGLADYLRAQASAMGSSFLSAKDAPHAVIATLREWADEVDAARGQGCELATDATKQLGEHSPLPLVLGAFAQDALDFVHLAMSTSSVASPAPLLEPSATDRSELPRELL